MKENIIATKFDPIEYAISTQSMKIGTHENKAIHSISKNVPVKHWSPQQQLKSKMAWPSTSCPAIGIIWTLRRISVRSLNPCVGL